tara:strand:+ start:483 stop:668 length:186 start_codon:yes stop_codon:yes gene_type:complete
LSQWLESTHISCYEGEDRYANSTLEEDADNRVLEDSRRGTFGGRWFEELFVEGSADMCEDN